MNEFFTIGRLLSEPFHMGSKLEVFFSGCLCVWSEAQRFPPSEAVTGGGKGCFPTRVTTVRGPGPRWRNAATSGAGRSLGAAGRRAKRERDSEDTEEVGDASRLPVGPGGPGRPGDPLGPPTQPGKREEMSWGSLPPTLMASCVAKGRSGRREKRLPFYDRSH